jgi:antitoxin HigA-1
MTEKFTTLGGPAIHPGAVLADELAELGANASDVARAIDVPVNRITEILGQRRSITADTALRLGRFLGNGPEIWLSLQQDYDLRTTRRQISAALKRIPRRRIVKTARSA